jgi:hypothetical protein
VTGDLSPFVKVSFLTKFWKTIEVREQALATAEIATRFSSENASDVIV